MEINLIKSDEELKIALKRLSKVFQAKAGTPEREEADLLSLVIGKYESEHYPMDEPDPIDAIKFMMNQKEIKAIDLGSVFGGRDRVSKVLNRKEPLTLYMIRTLSKMLDIPLETLVKEYPLDKPVKKEIKTNEKSINSADKKVKAALGSTKSKNGFRQAKKGKKQSKLKLV